MFQLKFAIITPALITGSFAERIRFRSYILFMILIPEQPGILVGPFMGGVLGIVQWWILRQEVDWAGWWIPISILAWTTGLTVMPGALTSGALPGALTGLTLVILFRYASPRAGHEPGALTR